MRRPVERYPLAGPLAWSPSLGSTCKRAMYGLLVPANDCPSVSPRSGRCAPGRERGRSRPGRLSPDGEHRGVATTCPFAGPLPSDACALPHLSPSPPLPAKEKKKQEQKRCPMGVGPAVPTRGHGGGVMSVEVV